MSSVGPQALAQQGRLRREERLLAQRWQALQHAAHQGMARNVARSTAAAASARSASLRLSAEPFLHDRDRTTADAPGRRITPWPASPSIRPERAGSDKSLNNGDQDDQEITGRCR